MASKSRRPRPGKQETPRRAKQRRFQRPLTALPAELSRPRLLLRVDPAAKLVLDQLELLLLCRNVRSRVLFAAAEEALGFRQGEASQG